MDLGLMSWPSYLVAISLQRTTGGRTAVSPRDTAAPPFSGPPSRLAGRRHQRISWGDSLSTRGSNRGVVLYAQRPVPCDHRQIIKDPHETRRSTTVERRVFFQFPSPSALRGRCHRSAKFLQVAAPLRLEAVPVSRRHDGSVVATIGARENGAETPAATGTCRRPGQVPAHPVANAEGRTRTANLRVMNPAL